MLGGRRGIGGDDMNLFLALRTHRRAQRVTPDCRDILPSTSTRAIASICCSPPLNRLLVVRRRSAS